MKKIVVATLLSVFAASVFPSSPRRENPEVYVTIGADPNFVRFSSLDSIRRYLDLCAEAGFNHVVLDVKPNYGKVLYRSEILPYLDYIEGVTPEPLGRDWDYLQCFIDECHSRGMRLSASFSVLPVGSPYWQRGLCYQDTRYDSLLCRELRPDGSLGDMRTTRKAAAFMNPARKDVQDYALGLILELVRKYDIDGFSLDYCRYPDAQSDFSDFSRKAFEKHISHTVENWPDDILKFNSDGSYTEGRLAPRWWAWRAGVVSDFVRRASEAIHAEKPDVDVEYWAATWIHALNVNGQNWASPRSPWVREYSYGTREYQLSGFAPYIDVFAAGAYLERVHGADDNESIEFAFNRADSLLRGDCMLVGSLYAVNHDTVPDNPNNMYNAATMSLEKTGNLRVFDISQVNKMGLWRPIRQAIDDYKSRHRVDSIGDR